MFSFDCHRIPERSRNSKLIVTSALLKDCIHDDPECVNRLAANIFVLFEFMKSQRYNKEFWPAKQLDFIDFQKFVSLFVRIYSKWRKNYDKQVWHFICINYITIIAKYDPFQKKLREVVMQKIQQIDQSVSDVEAQGLQQESVLQERHADTSSLMDEFNKRKRACTKSESRPHYCCYFTI
jgi:hypothetical protein